MNVAENVRRYVMEKSYVKKSLKYGILNYSKVARKIIKEQGLSNKDFDAIVVSLRRFSDKKRTDIDTNIANIMKNSRLEIRNKIAVIIIEKEYFGKNIVDLHKSVKDSKGHIAIIEGIDVVTIITSEEFFKNVEKYFHNAILHVKKNLAEIILRSPQSMEDIPGVTAYICGILAENDVNIIEMMSCWTDTIIVIDSKDIEKSIKALS